MRKIPAFPKSGSAYIHLAKAQLLTALTYKTDFILAILGNVAVMLASIYLWQAAYRSTTFTTGVAKDSMITYVVMVAMMNACYSSTIEFTLQHRITQGDVVVDFIRPIHLLGSYLAVDMGLTVSALVSRVLPMLAIAWIFFPFKAPASLSYGLLFLASAIMGYLILWLCAALIALICLWHIQLGHLGAVKDGFILLLSGRIVPAWLMPDSLRPVMDLLPFQHIYQTPLSFYIGQIAPRQAGLILARQALWTLAFFILVQWVWTSGKKHLLALGG